MLRIILVNISIILFLFLSCRSESLSEIQKIDPDYFLYKDLVLSEYAENLHYVKLSSEIIFGHIYNIELSVKYIFIGTDQGLLVFDHNGNYIRKIGDMGNAPMEYKHCMDFTVDNINEIIYLRDLPHIKVFSFNGEYLRSIKVSGNHVKTIYNNESLYLFPLLLASKYPTEYFWKQIDLDGNIIDFKANKEIAFENEGLTYRSNYAYKNSQFVGYWNQYCDTVYRITKDSISTGFVWNKGDFRLTPSKNISDDDNNCLVLQTIFETNTLLYMEYRKDTKRYICVYNKEKKQFTNQQITENKTGITNDIDLGIPFLPKYLSSANGEDYFIQCVYPDIIMDNNQLRKQNSLDGISADDNQILIIAKLK